MDNRTVRKQPPENIKRAKYIPMVAAETWQAVVSHIPSLIVSLSRDGTVLFLNRTITGRAVESVIGTSCFDYLPKDQFHTFSRALKQVYRSGNEIEVEIEGIDSTGGKAWYEVRIFAIREKGQIVNVCAIASDITKRRNAEEQVRQHQAEIAHYSRLNTMGEMATTLAHELNQPLAAIVNYATGCNRRLQSGDVEKQLVIGAIDRIAAQAERAGDIIHRLREFFKKGNVAHQLMDINAVVREAMIFLDPKSLDDNTTIALDLDEDLPKVNVDKIQIEQVILNIIQNALDAMRMANSPNRTVSIRTAMTRGNRIKIALCDTGPGMDEEVSKHVFEPFYTTKSHGMGMGLSICSSIIEAHGGSLVMLPRRRRGGCRFQFTLPVGEKDPQASQEMPDEALDDD